MTAGKTACFNSLILPEKSGSLLLQEATMSDKISLINFIELYQEKPVMGYQKQFIKALKENESIYVKFSRRLNIFRNKEYQKS